MSAGDALRIKSQGATIAGRRYRGSGETIVLLHGGPGMGDYFASLARILSPPHDVVSYDQRGCGKSICDGSFDIDQQLEDLDKAAPRSPPDSSVRALVGRVAGPVVRQGIS